MHSLPDLERWTSLFWLPIDICSIRRTVELTVKYPAGRQGRLDIIYCLFMKGRSV